VFAVMRGAGLSSGFADPVFVDSPTAVCNVGWKLAYSNAVLPTGDINNPLKECWIIAIDNEPIAFVTHVA